jgi:peptidylprolyl isomerase
MRRLLPLLLLALALALAACGADESEDTGGAEVTPSFTEGATSETTATTEAEAAPPAPEGKKPEVAKPKGDPPTKLVKKDLKKGSGAAAKDGDMLTVHYVGVAWSTGEEFDSSWDRGEPFTFPLGGGQVIKGWDQGLVGMKKGGQRRLEIPSDLAYGPAGSPPSIGPDEALIFVVDLVDIAPGG